MTQVSKLVRGLCGVMKPPVEFQPGVCVCDSVLHNHARWDHGLRMRFSIGRERIVVAGTKVNAQLVRIFGVLTLRQGERILMLQLELATDFSESSVCYHLFIQRRVETILYGIRAHMPTLSRSRPSRGERVVAIECASSTRRLYCIPGSNDPPSVL
jgi:hypothetical protein